MKHSYISAEILINEFHRRFKPSNDSWINDIPTIVADVIESVGVDYELFEPKVKEIQIKNGMVKFNFPYNTIIKIEHNCKELNVQNVPKCDCYNNPYDAKLQGSTLVTNFDKGTIQVHYSDLRVNEHGFIEIPNFLEFREACVWSLLTNWLGQGNLHPIFTYQYAEEKAIDYIGRATNHIKFPTPREEASFLNTWLNTQSFDSQ